MGPIFFPRKALTANIETVYGTDPGLTGANGIMAHNISLTPLEAETISDEGLPQNHLGSALQFLTNKSVSLEFEVECIGHASPGTAPKIGSLLRACSMQEIVTATTDVEHLPITENEESVSIGINIDGNYHLITGAKGNLTYALNLNERFFLKFAFKGLFNAPISQAFPSADFTGIQRGHTITNGLVSNFLLHTQAVEPRSLEIDMGVAVEVDQTLNAMEMVVADRQASGSIVFDAPNLSDYNWFDHVTAENLGALSFQVGSTAGRIVEISHPNVQLTEPKYGEEKKRATLEASLNVMPTAAGNDEFSLTFR